MSNLLERQVEAIGQRIVLLAPPGAHIPSHFKNVTWSADQHQSYLTRMQQLRGGVYFKDGAISELSQGGCHETPEDANSWHILLQGRGGCLNACIWYLEHALMPAFQQLRARTCALARDRQWRPKMQRMVAAEIAQARIEGIRFSEVGGWAVSEGSRCTTEGLMMILGTYSLSRAMGGALGLATATVRHSSSAILRRLGLSAFDDIPTYHDPNYGCDMELLKYDTRRSSPRYHDVIEFLKVQLAEVPVIVGAAAHELSTVMAGSPVSLSREHLLVQAESTAA